MITVIPISKARAGENVFRIHEPAQIANPFGISHRITKEECALAYEAWLKHRIANNDIVICAELNRIARFACDGEAVLVGSEADGAVIRKLIEEALNE